MSILIFFFSLSCLVCSCIVLPCIVVCCLVLCYLTYLVLRGVVLYLSRLDKTTASVGCNSKAKGTRSYMRLISLLFPSLSLCGSAQWELVFFFSISSAHELVLDQFCLGRQVTCYMTLCYQPTLLDCIAWDTECHSAHELKYPTLPYTQHAHLKPVW